MKQIDRLKDKISKLEKFKDDKIGNYSYGELKEILKNKEIVFPIDISIKLWDVEEEVRLDYFEFVETFKDKISTGITNGGKKDEVKLFIYYKVFPTLMAFGLVDKVKITGPIYEKMQASKDELKFFAKIDAEKLVIA